MWSTPAPHHYQVNSTFDPYNQDFTIFAPDGVTPVPASVWSIAMVQRSIALQSIVQGTQIGAALILLLALCLMTKTDKRRSLVFILNAAALALVVLRGIFSCLVYTSAFYNWYNYILHYYVNVSAAKAISTMAEFWEFMLTVTIEASLVLQVRIVCCNLDSYKRHLINFSNAAVAITTVCVHFALMVVDIKWNILNIENESPWQFKRMSDFASGANITLVISIGFSAIVFCTKLAMAIMARRSMGMKQFGPMQIIFVMGCQTMCTPFIFTMITYWGIKSAQVQSFVQAVVAITLPLSSMWAAANTSRVHLANVDPHNHRTIPVGPPNLASGKAYGSTNFSADTSNTLIDDDNTSLGTPPKKRVGLSEDFVDLEMQRLGNHVHVDRSYSVRAD